MIYDFRLVARVLQTIINQLKKLGGKEVKLTVYPEAQHDSWTETYNNRSRTNGC